MNAVRRRRATAAGVVAPGLLALAVAACGVPIEGSPRGVPADQLPAGLQTPETTVVDTQDTTESVEVWFVRDELLVGSRHTVEAPLTPQKALDELLLGPDTDEQGRALRSALPDAEVVLGATFARGIATVDLSPRFSEIPASDQLLAVAQIVLTLTDLRGVGLVAFQVEGAPIAVPLPSGESSGERVSRDDYFGLATTL